MSAIDLSPAERAALALRIGRQCRGVYARSWGSSCAWCGEWIPAGEERGFVPLLGALHVDCLCIAIDEADVALRQAREVAA